MGSDERDPVGVVLADVRDMGPVRVAEIVDDTGVSETTVRRALAELEDADLVESSEPYGDNRRNGRGRVWMAV